MNDNSPLRTIESFQAGDGVVWRYRRYLAPVPARADVVFIHGIQSHGGWYTHSCEALCQSGFNVYFLDRRGSGLNEANRGDAPSFRRLLDDLAEFLTTLTRTALTPGPTIAKPQAAAGSVHTNGSGRMPVFLAGISWGGKLAAALERRHPGLVDGLALLCPGFYSRVRPTLGQRLLIFLCRLFRPRKLFPIPLNEPDMFTANPIWQQFLRDDPLRLRQATARLLIESVRLDGYLHFVPKYVHVPVLLMLAEHDRIIHNGKTRAFVERFATPDKQVIEYSGAHHTLEFEPRPEKFIADLRDWLDRQIQARKKVAV